MPADRTKTVPKIQHCAIEAGGRVVGRGGIVWGEGDRDYPLQRWTLGGAVFGFAHSGPSR